MFFTYTELMHHGGNPTLVHGKKAIEKILRKQNIDLINRKKLFDRSTDHK